MSAMYCMDDYPLIGMDAHTCIPPRSVLASLKPMGLGTPFRESLSSYYLELAHLHHLSPKTLARELIIPRIKSSHKQQSDDTFTIWKLPLFNGIGTVPEIWAKQLSELTGQNSLIDLTLIPLRPYTNMQRLTSREKKWCPLCFSEAAQEGRAYGQLIWEIAVVEACPKHGIKLINRCGCNDASLLSTRYVKHLPGYCGSCGHYLAQNYEEWIETASADKVKRAQLVADLLGDTERLKGESDRGMGIAVFFKGAVQYFTGGNAALFGKLLGIKKNTLHEWIHGKRIPNFPQLVEIAFACKCSIADVMMGSQVAFEGTEIAYMNQGSQRAISTRKTQTLSRDAVVRQLEMLVDKNPPISVAMAAAKIGVNRRTLFYNFGNIAKVMNRRFQAHRHSEKIRNFARKLDLYRQCAMRLMQQGIKPTPKLVSLDIKGIGIVSNKEYERAACGRICREVIQNNQSS